MPRRHRSYVPGIPAHVVFRGVDRVDCFRDALDRAIFKDHLARQLARNDVRCHAYVLMTNHVHLLLTPSSQSGISLLMQGIGRGYVRTFNDRHGRTGALFEGRHHGSLIQSDRYLLACARYIELNPVRAGMTADPASYAYSSHRANAFGEQDPLLSGHPTIEALGTTPAARRRAYRRMFATSGPVDRRIAREAALFRHAVVHGHPLGTADFRRRIAGQIGREIHRRRRGRPRASAVAGARHPAASSPRQ